MTSPTNTAGLEVVDLNGLLHQAWERLHRSEADVPGALVVLRALHVALETPLVTAASAQARIAALEAKLEAADLALAITRMMVGDQERRAQAAEARADRLADGITAAMLILTPEPGNKPLTEREKMARQLLAALQQEG